MKRFLIAFIGATVLMGLILFLFFTFNSIPLLIVGILTFIVFILWSMGYVMRGFKPKDIPNGLQATATVISCRQGNMKVSVGGVNENYQLIIDVNVTNPQGETWKATMKEMINITQVGIFQPGVSFKVLYDPNDKSKVVFNQSNN